MLYTIMCVHGTRCHRINIIARAQEHRNYAYTTALVRDLSSDVLYYRAQRDPNAFVRVINDNK